MNKDLLRINYNPDVLSCLSNLSNDEVFTPPSLANELLDMLPKSLFSDPHTKFLDPCCKSGVFLREIAKRLIKGLETAYPNLEERLDHIFSEQLYGISITELTGELSRRSVYCSKAANGQYSVANFDNEIGNIHYEHKSHSFKNGTCVFCGATESEYGNFQRNSLENYAYEFIHGINEEFNTMKFDVIIGNPPYQLSDGGAQASAKPIYQHFVEQAKKLSPRYLSMIIPARWYAGGKGLDDFRKNMLTDPHIEELHDFPITSDCFPGVNIRGGVCYFLWNREFDNQQKLVNVVTHIGKNVERVNRPLSYFGIDIFIRNSKALPILHKVLSISNCDNMVSNHVSSRKPFGFATDFIKSDFFYEKKNHLRKPVLCYGKGLLKGYVELNSISLHIEWIDKWKLFTSRAKDIGTELNDDNLNVFIDKNAVCTESYLVIGADMNLTESEAIHFSKYLKTKFARFLHSLAKVSQDATSKTYRFVPMQDFSKEWTDLELYKKYGLNDKEILFIESMIKDMVN